MFFLRCAFWLSVVYASISWTPGTLTSAGADSDLIAVGRSQAQSLVETARAQVAAYCMHHARECLDDAAHLTTLVAAFERSADTGLEEPETTASIPLPVPDPRRHARDAKLARVP